MRRATVWWHDAHSESGDFGDKQIENKHRPLLVGQTGWIVKSDRTGITLSMERAPHEGNEGLDIAEEPYRFRFFVPKAMIQRIEWLEAKS